MMDPRLTLALVAGLTAAGGAQAQIVYYAPAPAQGGYVAQPNYSTRAVGPPRQGAPSSYAAPQIVAPNYGPTPTPVYGSAPVAYGPPPTAVYGAMARPNPYAPPPLAYAPAPQPFVQPQIYAPQPAQAQPRSIRRARVASYGAPAEPLDLDAPAARPHRGVNPKFMRAEVAYDGAHAPGTVIVDTPSRYLYLVQPGGRALRYGIGVGRPGFEWAGVKRVTRKAHWPDWRPPAEMRKRRPDLPAFMAGGPSNPLGARALYLGSSLYRIHGTNEPHTIGQNVSSGCIRMMNDDVTDLYDRVPVGAKVIVI